jgi:glycine/D-amino acid oxidase-like deaminating enzyme
MVAAEAETSSGSSLMRVVICGGGVIGACIAYFLSLRQVEVLVIERTGVACAASGKSGGFLALDWCDGLPLAGLARRSFTLHAELAGRLGDVWGYRRLDTLSVLASARRSLGSHRGAALPWLGPEAVLHGRLGTHETTAQVDPEAFTKGMLEAAKRAGARLQIGRVSGLARSSDGAVTGVIVAGTAIEADAVVVAMGPWSIEACGWLPLPPVYGLKGNSLTFRPATALSAHALFAEVELLDGARHSPEVVPRADGSLYICGLSSESPLPDDPALVNPDPGAADTLRAMARLLAPALGDAPASAPQACFRPVTRDGLPLIVQVPGAARAYVATGHSVCGILNAPATGEAMAELILDGEARTVDLSPFDPARLPPLEAGRR